MYRANKQQAISHAKINQKSGIRFFSSDNYYSRKTILGIFCLDFCIIIRNCNSRGISFLVIKQKFQRRGLNSLKFVRYIRLKLCSKDIAF